MKVIALFGLLTSLSLFASGLPLLDIQGLDGQYIQDSGQATAKVWQLPNTPAVNNASFTVLKEQDTFVFSGDAGEYTLENLPEIILLMSELNWQGANLRTTSSAIDLKLLQASGTSSTQSIKARGLDLSCKGSSSAINVGEAIIENCLKKANVQANFFELSESGRSISWLRSFFTSLFTNKAASKTGIENLTMSISNGTFKAKLKAKLDISVNIKADGKIELIQSSTQKEVRIRIDKVKASFLNVTKKVFEAIEDNPIDGVRVQRPYVFIELDS